MKLGLIITTFNRVAYLRQCLSSISKADLSQVATIMIVDDCSTDKETIKLINDFELEGVELIKAFSKENRSIKGSLLFGLDLLFNSCDVITNLDGDAIVTKSAFNRLLELHERFSEHIVSGFNCFTKNKDGSERHKVLDKQDTFTRRQSVGGINMIFSKERYYKWVRPALLKSIEQRLNWDDHTCRASWADGFEIITSSPSCVQHIGFESSMGHSTGGEPPDVADDFGINYLEATKESYDGIDFKMFSAPADPNNGKQSHNLWTKLQLPDITLVAADCVDVDRVIKAADLSCRNIEFGAVKILSSLPSKDKRVIQIRPLKTKSDYSEFCMKELANYIDTKYLLVFQYDGYVLNHQAWKDEWLEYDYIGAPWLWYTDGMQVGNGGFSLRSKKLMQITANDTGIIAINEPGVTKHKEEDHCICRLYRKYLEQEYKMKFAPVEAARQFSIEGWRSENKTWTNEFGFHGSGLTNIKP